MRALVFSSQDVLLFSPHLVLVVFAGAPIMHVVFFSLSSTLQSILYDELTTVPFPNRLLVSLRLLVVLSSSVQH